MNSILSFFLPRFCIFCSKKDEFVCQNCETKLKFIGNIYCQICGKPFLKTENIHACSDCLLESPAYSKHRSLFYFHEPVQKLIHEFKYQSQFWVAQYFAKHFIKLANEFLECDLILPIPLHIKRLKDRGYNQSLLLAKNWQRLFKKPVLKDVLTRVKPTLSQTTLDKTLRLENLRDAFFVKNAKIIENKNILLIDDVHTTGATLQMASRVLNKSGAKKVMAMSVAMVV